jgi:mono/diheme cytochrome c family protein
MKYSNESITAAFLAWVAFGLVFASVGFLSSPVMASSSSEFSQELQPSERFELAQQEETLGCRGPGHGGRGRHCRQMGGEKGCSGGKEGCPGRKGRGHRGGMGRGMHHGGGDSGAAQCPQPRTTMKAPEELYNRTNPVENTPDNIERGRLLFQLDAQPTCVLCHGSQGDGTGGFGANLSPPPRNFTCSETMKDISDGQLFWIIRNGSPDTGMPPFQDLQDKQIWNLIRFIRSLAR